jgi:ComF family protein
MRSAMKSATKNTLKTLAGALVDAVLPPRCLLSGEIVDRQGMLSPASWAELDFIAAPLCDCCGFPFDFATYPGALCGACLEDRPEFESARAALKYTDASRRLLLGFKHGDQVHAVRAFIPWLKTAGAGLLEQADLIVPVPLHRWRLFRRRYNQSAVIGHYLARETGVRLAVDALRRVRSTPPQGHMGARDRKKNVRNAFDLNPARAENVQGKTVILIDDVYTTGSTVRECTKTLLKGGAAKVHVLCVARVMKE